MQYRPALLALASLATAAGACTAEIEPAARCDEPSEDVGIDIELGNLDDAESYFLEVRAAGAKLLIARTPDQQATLDETPLAGDRQLTVALYDSTLRLYIAEGDGSNSGPEAVTVTIVSASGVMLAQETFAPAYEDAAPVNGTCGGFAVVTERIDLPLPEHF